MSLYLQFKDYALKNGDKNAIFWGGKFYKYKQVLTQIDCLANYLIKNYHIHENNVISICLNNSYLSLALIYALNKIGAIVNFISPALPSDQILYFDLLVSSRFLFLEKSIFLAYQDNFITIKEKIALLQNSKISIKNKFKTYHNKILKDTIPFKYKLSFKKQVKDLYLINNDEDVAIMCPNEQFFNHPYIASFTNKSLYYSFLNHIELYDNIRSGLMLCDNSMMSLPIFMAFFHTPLLNGIAINVNDFTDFKVYKKSIKSHKTTLFSGDYNAFERLVKTKTNIFKYLEKALIYNDIQRSYIFNCWSDKCYTFHNDIPLISCLGGVEFGGVFCYENLSITSKNIFSKFLGDAVPYIEKQKRNKTNNLWIKSKANMIGYYKQVEINDEITSINGIKSQYIGYFNNNGFSLDFDNMNLNTFNRINLYLSNIKDILSTIPGIDKVDIILKSNYVIELSISANKSENDRLRQAISNYFDTQIKKYKYTISFEN